MGEDVGILEILNIRLSPNLLTYRSSEWMNCTLKMIRQNNV
jgi:hypothetical protein